MRYDIDQILGIAFDGSKMTRTTCGLAIADDQLSLVTDVILERGITVVTNIAAAIQRKDKHVRPWVNAYDMYRTRFNQEKNMRATLSDPYKDVWDTWPERVWRYDNDSVELAQAHTKKDKTERTHAILQCVWNNMRSTIAGPKPATPPAEVKEEEEDPAMDLVNVPAHFTGELPRNSVVELSCFNRPDPEPLIEALKKPPSGYEDEPGIKRIMGFKCPFAFEWLQNKGWNADERLL